MRLGWRVIFLILMPAFAAGAWAGDRIAPEKELGHSEKAKD